MLSRLVRRRRKSVAAPDNNHNTAARAPSSSSPSSSSSLSGSCCSSPPCCCRKLSRAGAAAAAASGVEAGGDQRQQQQKPGPGEADGATPTPPVTGSGENGSESSPFSMTTEQVSPVLAVERERGGGGVLFGSKRFLGVEGFRLTNAQ